MRGRENVWARRTGLLAASALLLIGNLVFGVWYRGTARDRQEGLEGRRSRLEKEVAEAESEAAKVSGQRDRLSQVSSAITDFYTNRVGPRRETLAQIVEELHTVLQRVGVNPSQISYNMATVGGLPLTRMEIGFSFRNDYGKFKQLVAAFETDRRWIVVKDIGLSRDTDVPGGVQVRMRLATYFKRDEPQPQIPSARGASSSSVGE